MVVKCQLPEQDSRDIIDLTCDIADKLLDPIVDHHEEHATYPHDVFQQLKAAGLLTISHPEKWGKADGARCDDITDAVQFFTGVGYRREFRVERYMRETKMLQIFEGTNQIQWLVIARSLVNQ